MHLVGFIIRNTVLRVTSVGGVTVKKKLYCEVLEIHAVSTINQLCKLNSVK